MRRPVKIILAGIICSLFPALFSYLGQSSNTLDWMQKNNLLGSGVNIEILKDVCTGISIILTFTLLTVPLICSQINEKSYHKQRDDLIYQWKDIFVISLGSKLDIKNLNMDIRIFVPKVTLKTKMCKIISPRQFKLKFVIRNLDVLARHDTTDELKFEVYPNPEGLVGQCYTQKIMLNDDNLVQTNDVAYNLTPSQINKTKDLKFSLVCPIFNSDNEVISIVAFDSKQDIKFGTADMQKAVENSVLNFSQMLYSRVPELFKKEGGLL